MKIILYLAFVASTLALPRPNGELLPHRIVGGEQAIPNEFPWLVSMQYYGSHLCGGTIYNPTTIITAAHCAVVGPAGVFTVLAGKHNLVNTEPTQQLRQVGALVINSGYPGTTGFSNDIALLRLSAPLEYNAYVGPIPIAPPGVTATGDATVAGWGWMADNGNVISDTLNKVNLPIVTDDYCRVRVGPQYFEESMICAGFPEGGKDSCQHDSGGPLIANDRGTGYYLAGIVSWGYGCAQPGYPGVYSEISYHNSFIIDNSN